MNLDATRIKLIHLLFNELHCICRDFDQFCNQFSYTDQKMNLQVYEVGFCCSKLVIIKVDGQSRFLKK